MKKLAIIAAIFFTLETDGQTAKSKDLYLNSLIEHLEFWSKKDKNTKTFYVQSSDITKSFPEKIENVSVVYVEPSQILKLLSSKRELHIIEIKPAKIESEKIIIGSVDFIVSKGKNNTLNYAKIGSGMCEFVYDCAIKRFELQNKSYSGI